MGINRVTKRGKSRIEVRRRWPDGTTFRRFFPNRALANRVDLQIRSAILDGTWPDLKESLMGSKQESKETTVGEMVKRFLESTRDRVRPSTWKRYAYSLEFAKRDLGAFRFDRLERREVYRWMQARTQEVSPSTVNRDLTALKRVYGWAVEVGVIEQSPLVGIKPYHEPRKERPLLSLQDYHQLVDAAADLSHTEAVVLTAFILLLGETGCRKSEGLHLELQDCDFDRRTVTFNTVKGRRGRVVPMSERLAFYLQAMVSDCSEYVLTNPVTGKRLVDPKKGFQTAAVQAGVGWLQIHDMRRFRACQWASAGVPVPTVQKLLGHRSLDTTLRYLQHLDPDFEAVRAAFRAEKWETPWETNGRQGRTGKVAIGVSR